MYLPKLILCLSATHVSCARFQKQQQTTVTDSQSVRESVRSFTQTAGTISDRTISKTHTSFLPAFDLLTHNDRSLFIPEESQTNPPSLFRAFVLKHSLLFINTHLHNHDVIISYPLNKYHQIKKIIAPSSLTCR